MQVRLFGCRFQPPSKRMQYSRRRQACTHGGRDSNQLELPMLRPKLRSMLISMLMSMLRPTPALRIIMVIIKSCFAFPVKMVNRADNAGREKEGMGVIHVLEAPSRVAWHPEIYPDDQSTPYFTPRPAWLAL